ncbi:uncharacterized protein [Fopius arisanus]|uniref:SecA_2 protein n=1 Tax=Fopius arisanus TaxID=64838 RepID=A0A0C9RC11_9HYME|nr:PREDICTED: uncharacterized protein LOC105268999 [Fopius arisanus]
MFIFAMLCPMLMATGSQGLSPDLQRFQEFVTTKVRGLGEEVNRTLEEIVKDVDLHRTALVKNTVIVGQEHLGKVKKFKNDYLERAGAVQSKAPVKSGGQAPTPRPGDLCVESLGPVIHRINDAERALAHCVMKYIKSADKIIDDTNHAEREFAHKFASITQRINPCVTLHQGTPDSERNIRSCLEQIMDDGQILHNEVLPSIHRSVQMLQDFHNHPETDISHCARGVGMEYFDIDKRHELQFQLERCAKS